MCIRDRFSYIPALSAFYHSFTHGTGAETKWVGLANFEFMLRDRYLNASWGNMVKLTLFSLLTMVVPLMNAVAIFRLRSPRWQYRYRVLFILSLIHI